MTHLVELPFTENNLSAAMQESALNAKRGPAVFIANGKRTNKGKLIPDNCLPPVPKPAAKVSGNQLLVLRVLKVKGMPLAGIVETIGASPNTMSTALHTLMERHLILVKRLMKRKGGGGPKVRVYAISEAGRRALEAVE